MGKRKAAAPPPDRTYLQPPPPPAEKEAERYRVGVFIEPPVGGARGAHAP